jgi:hypothetical protein
MVVVYASILDMSRCHLFLMYAMIFAGRSRVDSLAFQGMAKP